MQFRRKCTYIGTYKVLVLAFIPHNFAVLLNYLCTIYHWCSHIILVPGRSAAQQTWLAWPDLLAVWNGVGSLTTIFGTSIPSNIGDSHSRWPDLDVDWLAAPFLSDLLCNHIGWQVSLINLRLHLFLLEVIWGQGTIWTVILYLSLWVISASL